VLSRHAFQSFANALPVSQGSRSTAARWWREPQVLPSAAAALIGLALSVSAWFAVSLREDRLAELDFNARANNHALLLQSEIADYVEKVAALRALFQSSPREVSRNEFKQFSQTLLHGQAPILAFSWLPRIGEAERAAHELAARRDGLADYRIKSASDRNGAALADGAREYFPVFYSNEEASGTPPFGLDLNDGGLRQQTLERARDHDRMATSPTFTLRSGKGDRTGFFVVLPVYRQDLYRQDLYRQDLYRQDLYRQDLYRQDLYRQDLYRQDLYRQDLYRQDLYRQDLPHETIDQRRANLVGYVEGVFQVGVLIDSILRASTSPGGLDLYFFASPSAADAPPIYFHPSRLRGAPVGALPRAALLAGPHWTKELHVGDAVWALVAAPIPSGPGITSRGGSWGVLAAGLLFTALLVAYLWASGRHARRLQAANRELDRTLAALERANTAVSAQNVRFDTALNNMSQGLIMFDRGERLVVCNQRYLDMYGLSPDVVKPGCSFRELLAHRRETGNLEGDVDANHARIMGALTQGGIVNFLLTTTAGREMSVAARPMAGGGWVATHEDITERRRSEAKIAYMARHDGLTDLPNRVLFHEQLNAALTAAMPAERLAVFCLDIDRFKGVNDTLGHPVGDVLLRSAADRLRACLRDIDAVARLGGDEFAIVQRGAAQPEAATALAARLIDAISVPYDLDGHQVVVGLSIGIAIAPDDGADPHQLLKNADMALYRAKADGRGRYRFFEPAMDARMQARRRLELDLRKAIVASEFELFYQPLVDIHSERVRGLEALIRWRHPECGMISPAEFIPLAEETGLIVPIGEWVLRQACQDAAGWPEDVKVAVNLSPIQFKSSDLLAAVTGALARSRLSASRLELEITESVLLHDNETTLAMLHQLRDLGVKIFMDDFGTGYSSLGYLRKFPFDKIKIDRSFIRDMSDRDDSLAIVRAVTAMGASLGMTTTAEGVETLEQLERLRKEGCSEVQGYFFSPPRPAAEIRRLLASLPPESKLKESKLKAIA
jgi:diguanylate cyclase (GGDEF)-like protein